VTGDPLDTNGCDHVKVILSVSRAVLPRPVGVAGDVDCTAGELFTDSPAALRAVTVKAYAVLALSPAISAADATPSYTGATGVGIVLSSYTRYPLTAAPVDTFGADQSNRIVDELWCSDWGTPGALLTVDCANDTLRTPSPAAFTALTWNTYRRPDSNPSTLTAGDDTVLFTSAAIDVTVAFTMIVTAASAVPSLRYTLYSVTSAPPEFTGAVHASPIVLAVCPVVFSAVGAAGAVDCMNTPLESPCPASLTAATWNEYVTPPDRPEIFANVLLLVVLWYAIILGSDSVGSFRYTM
jgi:hypothetical protein